jgi:hypothetical protein
VYVVAEVPAERLAHIAAEELAGAHRDIGRLICACTDVDIAITALLGAVFGINDDGQEAMLHLIDFNRKCEALKGLTKFSREVDLSVLRKLVDRAAAVMERRNFVAHAGLFDEKGTLILGSLAATKLMKSPERRVLKISGLSKISNEAERVATDCLALAAALGGPTQMPVA